jgi:hypothetical protein
MKTIIMKNVSLKWLLKSIPYLLFLITIVTSANLIIKLNKKNIELNEELKANKYWYSKSSELIIESANSKCDSAIAKNQIYFLASVTGYAGFVLDGIKYEDQENIKKKYKYIRFFGNGCRGSPPEEKDYDRAAFVYAKEFNTKMWKYVKSKENK